MSSFTFGKQEKLKSRKLIDQLFAEGKSVSVPPLRIVYLKIAGQDAPVKTGVSVSTRSFKKATDRNRIKRLLREAYRLNKAPLLQHIQPAGFQLALFIIYTDKALPELSGLNPKMRLILNKLIKVTSEAPSENS